MKYPKLQDTPIREIIFTITHDEISGDDCFEKFVKLEDVKSRFHDHMTGSEVEFRLEEGNSSVRKTGYRLTGNKEVLNLRLGAFSYHYIGGYKDFADVEESLVNYWNKLLHCASKQINVNSISVRYINEFETDADHRESRIIQVYPKYSSDRKIKTYQNFVSFSYDDLLDYNIVIVSTMPNEEKVLLDITVTDSLIERFSQQSLHKMFEPLQEIKNRAFFDSITAKALLKYLKN